MNNFGPKSDWSWGYLAPKIIPKLGNWLARRFPILVIIFRKAPAKANAYMFLCVGKLFPAGAWQNQFKRVRNDKPVPVKINLNSPTAGQ